LYNGVSSWYLHMRMSCTLIKFTPLFFLSICSSFLKNNLMGSCIYINYFNHIYLPGSRGSLTQMDLRKEWRHKTHERTHSEREWQDTWPEGWWPNWKIFIFASGFLSCIKQEFIQCKKNFYSWETMSSTWERIFLLQSPRLHKQNSDPPSINDDTQTSLFSPSFPWFHIHKTRG
jgi:hypothetical protein